MSDPDGDCPGCDICTTLPTPTRRREAACDDAACGIHSMPGECSTHSPPEDPRVPACKCGAPSFRALGALNLEGLPGVQYCVFGLCTSPRKHSLGRIPNTPSAPSPSTRRLTA